MSLLLQNCSLTELGGGEGEERGEGRRGNLNSVIRMVHYKVLEIKKGLRSITPTKIIVHKAYSTENRNAFTIFATYLLFVFPPQLLATLMYHYGNT